MGNLFLPNVLTDIHYNPSISLPAAKHSAAPYPFSFIQAVNSSLPIGEVQLFDTPRCVGTCAQQVYTKVFKTAAGNAIIAMMGTVPGYWVTIWLVDFMGRVAIQTLGFVMSTLLLIILAAGYTQIVKASYWIFIVLYAFTFFFMNFGPNATTFLTPVELFETKYRSTLHGFSAATAINVKRRTPLASSALPALA
ncbi:TPA: Proton phosphate symporter [Trebouxia sp. C0004]